MKTLIILIILLPTLCQANGIKYRDGFIQDAADERLVANIKPKTVHKDIGHSQTVHKTLIPQYAPEQRVVSLRPIIEPQADLSLADTDKYLDLSKINKITQQKRR